MIDTKVSLGSVARVVAAAVTGKDIDDPAIDSFLAHGAPPPIRAAGAAPSVPAWYAEQQRVATEPTDKSSHAGLNAAIDRMVEKNSGPTERSGLDEEIDRLIKRRGGGV